MRSATAGHSSRRKRSRSLLRGLDKLEINHEALAGDLDVDVEPIELTLNVPGH